MKIHPTAALNFNKCLKMSGILRVLSSSNLAVNISLKHKSSWTLTTWFYVVISKKKILLYFQTKYLITVFQKWRWSASWKLRGDMTDLFLRRRHELKLAGPSMKPHGSNCPSARNIFLRPGSLKTGYETVLLVRVNWYRYSSRKYFRFCCLWTVLEYFHSESFFIEW